MSSGRVANTSTWAAVDGGAVDGSPAAHRAVVGRGRSPEQANGRARACRHRPAFRLGRLALGIALVGSSGCDGSRAGSSPSGTTSVEPSSSGSSSGQALRAAGQGGGPRARSSPGSSAEAASDSSAKHGSGAGASDAGAPSAATGPPSPVTLGPVVDLGPPRLVAIEGSVVVGLDTAMQLQAQPLAAIAPPTGDEPVIAAAALVAPTLVGASPTHAYWVASGKLMRQKIEDGRTVGSAEEVTDGATDGLPVAAERVAAGGGIDVVAYIGLPEGDQGERPAKLWISGQGAVPLSRQSGNASAVGLVSVGNGKLVALSFDGRLGMSLLHAVQVDLDATGRARVGEDRVVFVGGSAERNTRFETSRVGNRALVFLPIANETAGFGLASLLVPEGKGEAVPLWRDYPNGLDPAPVSAAVICGIPHVALARPEGRSPDAGHAVELAAVGPDGALGPAVSVGKAGRVAQVVLAPTGEGREPRSSGSKTMTPDAKGGWIAYAADTGLWAHSLQCPEGSKP